MSKFSIVGKDNSLFSTRKPTDAVAGFSSGLKSFGKGLGLGLGSIIATPIIGAKEGGVKGFFAGLVGGTVAGCAMIATGATVGAIQVGRGIVNTPETIIKKNENFDWDASEQKWI